MSLACNDAILFRGVMNRVLIERIQFDSDAWDSTLSAKLMSLYDDHAKEYFMSLDDLAMHSPVLSLALVLLQGIQSI